MQLDLVQLLPGLAPANGTPPATGETGGGFLAAILEMAGEMGLPPGELLALAGSPGGKAMLERIAKATDGSASAAADLAAVSDLLSEEGAGMEIPEDLLGKAAETPKKPVSSTWGASESEGTDDAADSAEADLDIPLDSVHAPAPPEPRAQAIPAVPVQNVAAAAQDPAAEFGNSAEAELSVQPAVRSVSSAETAPVRPAPATPSASPAATTPPEPVAVLAQIGERVRMAVREGRPEMRMQLEPPGLGHVRVHIATEHGHVTVRMMADVPAVRDVLESGLAQLRAGLENQGLEVDGFEVLVSGGGPGDRGGFAGFDPGGSPDRDPAGEPREDGEPVRGPAVSVRSPRTAGGIDYFA